VRASDPTPTPSPTPQSAPRGEPSFTAGGGGSAIPSPLAGLPGPGYTAPQSGPGITTYSYGKSTLMQVPHDPTAPKVYFGPQYHGPKDPPWHPPLMPGANKLPSWLGTYSDDIRASEDAMNDVHTWNADKRAAMGKKLYAAGLISDPNSWDEINKVWYTAVQEAGLRFSATNGKDKVTPYDLIDMMAGVGGNGKGKNSNRTMTHTSVSTQTLDQESADGIVRAIFQQSMGRDPTDGELSDYRTMMTGYAKDHPQTTTTTTKYDGQGNEASSTSNTKGGITESGLQNMAAQHAQADPEYGTYQAATTYWNALLGMIGGGS
jgi:hypothetical protein